MGHDSMSLPREAFLIALGDILKWQNVLVMCFAKSARRLHTCAHVAYMTSASSSARCNTKSASVID